MLFCGGFLGFGLLQGLHSSRGPNDHGLLHLGLVLVGLGSLIGLGIG